MSGIYIHESSPVLFPWYEKSRKQRFQCGILQGFDTSHWIRISPGLDDFRFGPPSSSKGNLELLKKTPEIISISNKRIRASTSITPSKYRKMVGASKTQITETMKIERTLNQPLKILPLLEKSLPPEVFGNLIAMLHEPDRAESELDAAKDSKMNITESIAEHLDLAQIKERNKEVQKENKIKNRWAKPKAEFLIKDKQKKTLKLNEQKDDIEISESTVEDSDTGLVESILEGSPVIKGLQEEKTEINPYKTFIKQRIQTESLNIPTRGQRKLSPVKPPEQSLSLHEIAEDFCKWAQNLVEDGGEPVNIEPEKLIAMFAVNPDYTGLVTTVRILDKLNIPELRKSQTSSICTTILEPPAKTKVEQSKLARRRYGAWYLDVKLWNETLFQEKLEHPDDIKRRKCIEDSLRTDQLNDILKNLHIIKSFRTYLMKQHIKMPHFMKNIPLPILKRDEKQRLDIKTSSMLKIKRV